MRYVVKVLCGKSGGRGFHPLGCCVEQKPSSPCAFVSFVAKLSIGCTGGRPL